MPETNKHNPDQGQELQQPATEKHPELSKDVIKRMAWQVILEEYATKKILGNVANGRELREQLGEHFNDFPEHTAALAVAEQQLSEITVASTGQLFEAPVLSTPSANIGTASLAGQIMSMDQFDDKIISLLPLEKRIDYIARELAVLDLLESTEHIDMLKSHLHELIYRFRNCILNDPAFDDAALFAGAGDTSIMLLYLATENAYAGDFTTAGEIIGDMNNIPHVQKFLFDELKAAQTDIAKSRIVPDKVSEENLKAFVGDNLPDWREQARQTQFGLTIGIQPDIAIEIFGRQLGKGRLLTALEVATSGGKTVAKRQKRSSNYNNNRLTAEREQLDSTDNLFAPSLVYGALNTLSRPDQGNGYGPIVLRLKDIVGTSYSIGDSMPTDQLKRTSVGNRRVNREDAETAAVFNEAHGAHSTGVRGNWYSTQFAYVEAQIPGVTFDDIESVSLVAMGNEDGEPEKMLEAAKLILKQGIPVSFEFHEYLVLLEPYIDPQDENLNYGNQIRHRVDPTGEHWAMIHVKVIDPIPKKLSLEQIVANCTSQGIDVEITERSRSQEPTVAA